MSTAVGPPSSGGAHARAGSCRSTACCSWRSSTPGSMPSSSSRTCRSWRKASSASACRPDRVSASTRSAQSRSRSGCRPVSASLGGGGRVVAESHPRGRPVLEGDEARPRGRPLGRRRVRLLQLGEGLSAPPGQRLVQRRRGGAEAFSRSASEDPAADRTGPGAARSPRGRSGSRRSRCRAAVHSRVPRSRAPVPGPAGHALARGPCGAPDVPLKGGGHRAGRAVTPEQVHDRVHGDRTAGRAATARRRARAAWGSRGPPVPRRGSPPPVRGPRPPAPPCLPPRPQHKGRSWTPGRDRVACR